MVCKDKEIHTVDKNVSCNSLEELKQLYFKPRHHEITSMEKRFLASTINQTALYEQFLYLYTSSPNLGNSSNDFHEIRYAESFMDD